MSSGQVAHPPLARTCWAASADKSAAAGARVTGSKAAPVLDVDLAHVACLLLRLGCGAAANVGGRRGEEDSARDPR